MDILIYKKEDELFIVTEISSGLSYFGILFSNNDGEFFKDNTKIEMNFVHFISDLDKFKKLKANSSEYFLYIKLLFKAVFEGDEYVMKRISNIGTSHDRFVYAML